VLAQFVVAAERAFARQAFPFNAQDRRIEQRDRCIHIVSIERVVERANNLGVGHTISS
jgi:hypothetical protein